jgi:hypothetical protein
LSLPMSTYPVLRSTTLTRQSGPIPITVSISQCPMRRRCPTLGGRSAIGRFPACRPRRSRRRDYHLEKDLKNERAVAEARRLAGLD